MVVLSDMSPSASGILQYTKHVPDSSSLVGKRLTALLLFITRPDRPEEECYAD
jgi:hypothetical protein